MVTDPAEDLAAEVLVLATPTCMGQPSNVCQRVLERLDAELSEQDGLANRSFLGR